MVAGIRVVVVMVVVMVMAMLVVAPRMSSIPGSSALLPYLLQLPHLHGLDHAEGLALGDCCSNLRQLNIHHVSQLTLRRIDPIQLWSNLQFASLCD